MSEPDTRTAVQFVTEDGVSVLAVTTDQMRDVDRIAVEETGPSLLQMMENAGRSLAELALQQLDKSYETASVLVLAGGGGNGGGGICAARRLAGRVAEVILCMADAERLSDAARQQRQIFSYTSGREVPPGDLAALRPDLVVDALIGYGLASAPRGIAAEMIQWANACGAPTLSLDVPSGANASTGEAPGVVVRPATTLTLALPKTGLASVATGVLFLADLGIPEKVYRRLGLPYRFPFGDRFWVELRALEPGVLGYNWPACSHDPDLQEVSFKSSPLPSLPADHS